LTLPRPSCPLPPWQLMLAREAELRAIAEAELHAERLRQALREERVRAVQRAYRAHRARRAETHARALRDARLVQVMLPPSFYLGPVFPR